MQVKFLFPAAIIVLLTTFGVVAQDCPANSLLNRQVRASATDPDIPFELFRHQVWINTACSPNQLLLLHLTGTADNPSSTMLFPALAANNGYRVVSLKYSNGTSAQSDCRTSSDPNCYENFRREVIEGVDLSDGITVDRPNSIENRLLKLLMYLAAEYPDEGWNDFFNGEEIQWDRIVASGHSQGGGHAAFLARDRVLHRVLMFASPNDYSAFSGSAAPWTTQTHLTPASAYFAFGNKLDDIVDFAEEYQQWEGLGINAFGDTINVLTTPYPFQQSQLLYTNEDKPGLAVNHSLMLLDNQLTLDESGTPIYETAWRYMLGIPDGINATANSGKHHIKMQVFPNPVHKQATIQITGNPGPGLLLKICSMDGKVVKQQALQGPLVPFDRQQLANGLYSCQLWQEGKFLVETRVIIQ